MNPGDVPSSNLVFLRSRRKANLTGDFKQLADHCWRFHQEVIQSLAPKVIVCLGKDSGNYVRNKLSAHKQTDQFVERNKRRWTSVAYEGSNAQPKVVVLTHPSIADWTTTSTDPTHLVMRALQKTIE